MGRLAQGMVLLLPFPSLYITLCHIVHLCYGCTTLATASWQGMGLVYTYVVHIVWGSAEKGCIATLQMHGWSHTWFTQKAPMVYSDEAGQRDLRVAKGYALWTSTR